MHHHRKRFLNMKILTPEEYEINTETGVCALLIEPTCPDCGSLLASYGTRKRLYFDPSGKKHELRICRARCTNKNCRKIHHILPEGFIPYKRYQSSSIETATDPEPANQEQGIGCEERTVRNWHSWFTRFRKRIEKAAEDLGVCPSGKCGFTLPLLHQEQPNPGWLGSAVCWAVNTFGIF